MFFYICPKSSQTLDISIRFFRIHPKKSFLVDIINISFVYVHSVKASAHFI